MSALIIGDAPYRIYGFCENVLQPSHPRRETERREQAGEVMDEPPYKPSSARAEQLDSATPAKGDFVLYCKMCAWFGETNAAHAKADRCPACARYDIRIWRRR